MSATSQTLFPRTTWKRQNLLPPHFFYEIWKSGAGTPSVRSVENSSAIFDRRPVECCKSNFGVTTQSIFAVVSIVYSAFSAHAPTTPFGYRLSLIIFLYTYKLYVRREFAIRTCPVVPECNLSPYSIFKTRPVVRSERRACLLLYVRRVICTPV